MKPLFSISFTIVLIVVLLVPFFLTHTSTKKKLEPYPAIILPSGAGKLDLKQGIIRANTLSLYGYNAKGKLQKIDLQNFLNPIPERYIYSIVENDFGLSTKKKEKILIKVLGRTQIIEVKRKQKSRKDRKIAKDWFAQKLTILGLSNSSIVVRYEQKKIDIDSGKEIANEITNEKIILLR